MDMPVSRKSSSHKDKERITALYLRSPNRVTMLR